MLLNREYIPLKVTTVKGKTFCGGHEVSKLLKDEGDKVVLSELIAAFKIGDTKHQFIESILPFFEMTDDDQYLGTDYVYTADTQQPAILGNEEEGILGLYIRKDIPTLDENMAAFKKAAAFYIMLLQAMDDDNVRYVDDIIHYVKRLGNLRSIGETSFKNDFLLVPFVLETPWRVVENVMVPFNIYQFQMKNTDDDNALLGVHYTVSDAFLEQGKQLTVIHQGSKTFVNDIVLKFPDLCLLFEEDTQLPVFHMERKSSRALKRYRDVIEKHWKDNPVPTTEIEPE